MQDILRKQKEITSEKIIKNVQEQLISFMPFMNRAILKMPVEFFETKEEVDDLVEEPTARYVATDGVKIYIDPDYVIEKFKESPAKLPRVYMHMLFHCIFFHPFQYDKVDFEIWDFSTDAAVENTMLELGWKDMGLPNDAKRREYLARINRKISPLTAENLYMYYKENPDVAKKDLEYAPFFKEDDHEYWVSIDNMVGKQRDSDRTDLNGRNNYALEEWKQVGKSIQLNVESLSRYREKMSGDAAESIRNIFKEKYSYRDFLKKFVAPQEEMKINQDEFDYIFYTYGMKLYGNLPLIEPLEYKDTDKIKDFVIAIDTSGSCQGKVVRSFLNKTYTIIKESGTFMDKMNLHIIQCDSRIKSAVKITSQDDFDNYMSDLEVKGFGGTDFRPVFEYVNTQLRNKEFQDFRGLLYLTDGNGVYPKAVPEYPTAFIVVEDPKEKPEIPNWIIKLIMPQTEFEKEEFRYYR